MADKETLVASNTKELKRNTRMGYLKTIVQGLFLGLVGWQTYLLAFADNSGKDKSHIAVIEIKGEITSGSRFGDGIKFGETIDSVIANPNVKAVLIEANSPGGSPTQAEIMVSALSELVSEKPVIVSVGDLCASACLFALASNPNVPIYAHRSSLIGSVGVKLETWDVSKVLEKFEIQKRTYSLGDHKVFLDPFTAPDEKVEEHIRQELLTPIYEQFKGVLEVGRKGKLVDDPRVFTGLMWTGDHAKELGMVDDIKTNYEIRKTLESDYDTSSFVYYNSQKRTLTEMLTVSLKPTIMDVISAHSNSTKYQLK